MPYIILACACVCALKLPHHHQNLMSREGAILARPGAHEKQKELLLRVARFVLAYALCLCNALDSVFAKTESPEIDHDRHGGTLTSPWHIVSACVQFPIGRFCLALFCAHMSHIRY